MCIRVADKRSFALSLGLAIGVLLLDQASKWVLLGVLEQPGRGLIEVTSFFNLALVWNRGISFGMFAGRNQPFLLIGLSLVIMAILLKWLSKNTLLSIALALGCVIGGASGNVIDRLRFGAVTDFFDFHVGSYHWPAFNVADSAIFIGVVLLCLSSMIHPAGRINDGTSA